MSNHVRGVALGAFLLTSACASTTVLAADDSDANNARISGIVIGTYQAASKSRANGQDVHNEGNGQFDLLGGLDMGPGTWTLEVRGGTTPRHNGVTAAYGEANSTVGETLNSDGQGRIAATQLFYTLPAGPGELSVGLVDPTGFLDASDIANDEYSQFMGASFVNNPSIEFPSFVLGAAYHGTLSRHLGYQLFASSSSGLEDENDPTYHNVFDIGEHGKGAFTAGELQWQALGLNGNVGVWYNSADHARLDNAANDDKHNYGAYAGAGGPIGPGRWNLRAGVANDKVSSAANFLSVAYAQPIGDTTLGVGLARIGVSDHQPAPAASIVQAEVYWRINVLGNAYVTPDLQYIDNSGFDSRRDGVVVAGLRAGVEF